MLTNPITKLAAVGLLVALQAPVALADPTISGTTGTGNAGGTANPTLSVVFSSADTFNSSALAGWNFNLSWGSAPLTLDLDNSTMAIGANAYSLTNLIGSYLPATVTYGEGTPGDGYFSLSWLDQSFIDNFTTPWLDLSAGVVFTAQFNIDATAAAGTYDIGFATQGGATPSAFTDGDFNEFAYSDVTAGQNLMQVQVLGTTSPVPEPDTLLLMAGGGLGLMLAARRRRATLRTA